VSEPGLRDKQISLAGLGDRARREINRRTIMTEQEIAQALADWEAHQKRKAEVAARAK